MTNNEDMHLGEMEDLRRKEDEEMRKDDAYGEEIDQKQRELKGNDGY